MKHKILAGLAIASLITLATTAHPCHATDLQDSKCTPGVVRTTDKNIICNQTTGQFRPPVSYTDKLKLQQIKEYGYKDTNPADYEEDHLLALTDGGDGYNPKNLWPQPYSGQYGAHEKDKVEVWIHSQICSGKMTVQDGQKALMTNWIQVYNIIPNKSPVNSID